MQSDFDPCNNAVKPRARTETVYNLEVRVDHTFFVTEQKMWVHNTHSADFELRNSGGQIETRGTSTSGGGGGGRLSWPEQLARHTEAKIVKGLSARTSPGDIVTIRGTLPSPAMDARDG